MLAAPLQRHGLVARKGRCQADSLLRVSFNAGPQVWVGVVPCGPTGATLNSSYANRSSDK